MRTDKKLPCKGSFTLFIMLFCLSSLLLSSCAKTEAKKIIPETKKTTTASADTKAEEKNSDPKEVILADSTDDFLADNDEDVKSEFLDWFEEFYGRQTLESIVKNGVLDDPSVWRNSTGRTIKTLFWDFHQAKKDSVYKANKVKEIETESSDKATFLFSGDLTLAENTATTVRMDKNSNSLSQCFDQRLMNTMREADFFTINNEFCYADADTGKRLPGKAFCFRADPKRVKLLSRIGADLVSLANNHVYDYGADAFESTLDTLEKNGTPYVGAGENLNEAKKAYYTIANGRTVAIIAATQIERSTNFTKKATADSPGVLKCLDPEQYVDAIKTAKHNADIVIAICHWGTEGTHIYGGDQTSLANDFIKAGADAVIGGHTHTLQAAEYIKRVPVFYSLGNFYFSSTMNMPRAYDTGLAQITVKKDGSLSEDFIPCHFSGGKTVEEAKNSALFKQIITEMNSWSKTATITKNGMIKHK